jgi:hypothetical protein
MPDQIYPGDFFANGQQVDATRLNDHVGKAVLKVGAITEQAENTGIVGTDVIPFADVSANTINKIKVADLFLINVPIKPSNVETGVISAVPTDGRITVNSASKNYTPGGTYYANGYFITVTLSSHEVKVGDFVTLYTSGGLDGTYWVETTTSNTFVCRLNTNVSSAVGGVVTYFTRNATATFNGNVSSNSLYSPFISSGVARLGSLLINGKTPLTVEDNLSKVYVKFGTATGAAGGGVENMVYQTPVFTVPSGETWIYEVYVQTTSGHVNGNTRSAYGDVKMTVYNNATLLQTINGSTAPYGGHVATHTFATSFTSADVSPRLIVKTLTNYGYNEEPKYMIKLTKVKTSTLSDASSCI